MFSVNGLLSLLYGSSSTVCNDSWLVLDDPLSSYNVSLALGIILLFIFFRLTTGKLLKPNVRTLLNILPQRSFAYTSRVSLSPHRARESLRRQNGQTAGMDTKMPVSYRKKLHFRHYKR